MAGDARRPPPPAAPRPARRARGTSRRAGRAHPSSRTAASGWCGQLLAPPTRRCHCWPKVSSGSKMRRPCGSAEGDLGDAQQRLLHIGLVGQRLDHGGADRARRLHAGGDQAWRNRPAGGWRRPPPGPGPSGRAAHAASRTSGTQRSRGRPLSARDDGRLGLGRREAEVERRGSAAACWASAPSARSGSRGCRRRRA